MDLNEHKTITVTRLDAARAQMETAIDLYFATADPISIHALAAAAYDIVYPMCKKRGTPPLFKDMMMQTVKPEYRKMIGQMFRTPRNFFTHAGTMQKDSIDFTPAADDWLLYDAGAGYQYLTGSISAKALAYRAWFVTTHHDMILPGPLRDSFEAMKAHLRGLARADFYREALRAFDPPHHRG